MLWKSLLSPETGEKTVPGDRTQTVLEGLTPETLYQVSVVAVYPHGGSPPLLGQETTDGEKDPVLVVQGLHHSDVLRGAPRFTVSHYNRQHTV